MVQKPLNHWGRPSGDGGNDDVNRHCSCSAGTVFHLRSSQNTPTASAPIAGLFVSTATEGLFVEDLVGKNIVVDVESLFVYLGRLHEVRDKTLVLKNADVHDLRDSTTSREVYVRDARVHGVQPNRKSVQVRLEQVVSVSLLDDVIE